MSPDKGGSCSGSRIEQIRQANRRKFMQITGTTLAGAGAAGIAGCLGGESDENEEGVIQIITDHSSPQIQETLQNAFDDWASTIDQDVEAEFLFRGFDEVVETLQRSFETGDEPDIVFLNSEWAWRFGAEGRLADLSDQLENQSVPEDFKVDVDGSSVFWPHDIGVMTMWHRGDIYEEAGIEPAGNWDEQLSNLETLSSHLEGSQMEPMITFANPNVGVTQYNYDAQMMMNGVDYLDPSEDGEDVAVVLDEEPNRERAIEVLEHLQAMYQYSPESTSYEWDDMVEVYMSEQVSTTLYTGRAVSQAMQEDPDGLGANTQPAPYPDAPLVEQGEEEYQTVMTVGGFFCPAEAGNVELSKDFISHYMTTDWYIESLLAVPLHNVPPDTSVMDNDAFQEHEIVSQRPDVVDYYKEYADDGVLPIERTDPPLPYYFDLTMYTYIIPTMMAEGITGRKDPGEAVDDAAAELRDTLPQFQE